MSTFLKHKSFLELENVNIPQGQIKFAYIMNLYSGTVNNF